ncbi:MAG: RagB/SusD family nutrient uptake outer membrane protein [Sphingobacteriales bacterium]|nr:MAG: RagB/SusD family nutrient uptake outer membrane protein [Sphingobacteriales bacterium]
MNKIHKSIILCLVAVTMLYSCKKDFLNLEPPGQVSDQLAWKDGPLAEAFVNGIYAGLGLGGFHEEMLASFSDEAIFTHAGRGFNIVNEGILNPSNLGWGNGNYQWNQMYTRIRATLIAMSNLPSSPFDATLRDRLRGEAMFLYAYYNHQLLRYYGGGPIITKVYGLDEDYALERGTWEANVNNIVKYCDSAVLMLNGKSMQKGRASANAARALKARVLLYAASDLHDVPTAKSKSTVINSFANTEILGYPSGNRVSRWTLAKAAAKAVLDATTGYKLNLAAPEDTATATKNYISIAMGGGSKAPGVDATAESEILFGRYFIPAKGEAARQHGLNNGPNGYNNWAGNSPIQQLVDDYEMMDGTKFNWTNTAHKAEPYKGREPRFYAHILYDGAKWKPRGSSDPANEIQTGHYQGSGGATIYGLDTRQGPVENWNGSWTGYYVRKFIDPNPALNDNKDRQDVPWPFFRYTELVLNYAEACIELGEDAEARTWLNKIRFRAGLPAFTESGDALRQRYRNERRIELAYEEHRWHDARRWMIAPTTLGRKNVYILVRGTLKAGQTPAATYRKDPTKYDYTYTPTVDNSLENRNWLDKMYFLPIARDEGLRNSKIIQNPGYQ